MSTDQSDKTAADWRKDSQESANSSSTKLNKTVPAFVCFTEKVEELIVGSTNVDSDLVFH